MKADAAAGRYFFMLAVHRQSAQAWKNADFFLRFSLRVAWSNASLPDWQSVPATLFLQMFGMPNIGGRRTPKMSASPFLLLLGESPQSARIRLDGHAAFILREADMA
ncbi:hypothetical protein [Variovorax sp. tm]|uniref:hypothetical protein n=1 Tax=Variovorax atrisoli TaxID=3394203 RepID=UPI003A7FD16B